MQKFIFAINSNEAHELKDNEPADALATYDIEASSKEDAKDVGFTRFCQEHPDLSQDINDYTTDVGCQKS